MNPHSFSLLDPDPHSIGIRPDPHSIGIRPDPHHWL